MEGSRRAPGHGAGMAACLEEIEVMYFSIF